MVPALARQALFPSAHTRLSLVTSFVHLGHSNSRASLGILLGEHPAVPIPHLGLRAEFRQERRGAWPLGSVCIAAPLALDGFWSCSPSCSSAQAQAPVKHVAHTWVVHEQPAGPCRVGTMDARPAWAAVQTDPAWRLAHSHGIIFVWLEVYGTGKIQPVVNQRVSVLLQTGWLDPRLVQ